MINEKEKIRKKFEEKAQGFLSITDEEIDRYLMCVNKNTIPPYFDLFSHKLCLAIENGEFDIPYKTYSSIGDMRLTGVVYDKDNLQKNSEKLNFLYQWMRKDYAALVLAERRQGIPFDNAVINDETIDFYEENRIYILDVFSSFLQREYGVKEKEEVIQRIIDSGNEETLADYADSFPSETLRLLIDHDIKSKTDNPILSEQAMKCVGSWRNEYLPLIEGDANENVLTAIANNEKIDDPIRDTAYLKGINVENIQNTTKKMEEDIYFSYISAIFEDYDTSDKTEGIENKRYDQIQNFCEFIKNSHTICSSGFHRDLYERIIQERNRAGGFSDIAAGKLLYNLANRSTDAELLNDIAQITCKYPLKLDEDEAIKEVILTNPHTHNKTKYKILQYFYDKETCTPIIENTAKAFIQCFSKASFLQKENYDFFINDSDNSKIFFRPLLRYFVSGTKLVPEVMDKLYDRFSTEEKVFASINKKLRKAYPKLVEVLPSVYSYNENNCRDMTLSGFINCLSVGTIEKTASVEKITQEKDYNCIMEVIKQAEKEFTKQNLSHHENFKAKSVINFCKSLISNKYECDKLIINSPYFGTEDNGDIHYAPRFYSEKLTNMKDKEIKNYLKSIPKQFFDYTYYLVQGDMHEATEYMDFYHYNPKVLEEVMRQTVLMEEVMNERRKEKEELKYEIEESR